MDAELGINKEDLEILRVLKKNPHFQSQSVKIIEDCYTILGTSGAKLQNFNLLHISPDSADEQGSNPLAEQLPEIYNAILTLLAATIKSKYFPNQVLSIFKRDLGIKSKEALQAIAQRMQLFYDRMAVISQPYDAETGERGSMDRVKPSLRKMPLNEELHSELQGVNFAKIVDLEWKVVHCVSYRDLNRVAEPIFKLKLTLHGTETEMSGAVSQVAEGGAVGKTGLKKVEVECTREEVQFIVKQLGSALRACERVGK